MANLTQEDLTKESTSDSTAAAKPGVTGETVEQDPLKPELDKVNQTGKSERERAEQSLRYNALRLKKLGGDPASLLGFDKPVEAESEDDDSKPVTIGMLRRREQLQAEKSALQLAEEIPNETERELTKHHLQNSIKSTGNPQEDLRLARAIVNEVKSRQIAEEVARKTAARNHSSGSSAPAKEDESLIFDQDLTPEELTFMRPPFNVTKQDIMTARKKSVG